LGYKSGNYPRAGGETSVPHGLRAPWRGPSPRWRGDRACALGQIGGEGTIPALAGRPTGSAPMGLPSRDHPRAGGETFGRLSHFGASRGPSPRWRGDLDARADHQGLDGTIPALAGRPDSPGPLTDAGQDHPRAGGETREQTADHRRVSGPSPRWRGDLDREVQQDAGVRTIPALAGRPSGARGPPA